jgi:quercetin dioxygenase-like cupin family protein
MSLGTAKTALTDAETDEVTSMYGSRIQFLTAVPDADDEYCVCKSTLPPGAIVPVHSHPERETFHILEREAQGLPDDSWITLGRNGVFDVRGGIKHAWRNVSDSLAAMSVVAPMRLARFVRGPLLSPAGKRGAPAPEEVLLFFELTQAHGYWFSGLEDNAAAGLLLG